MIDLNNYIDENKELIKSNPLSTGLICRVGLLTPKIREAIENEEKITIYLGDARDIPDKFLIEAIGDLIIDFKLEDLLDISLKGRVSVKVIQEIHKMWYSCAPLFRNGW